MPLCDMEMLRRVVLSDLPKQKDPGKNRTSAVLIPFMRGSDGESLEILFIRRSDDLPTHPGQVAFPGGSVESGDRDHRHTALREAQEEVGLPPEQVEIVGPLDDLNTVTGYHIRPYVGLVHDGFVPRSTSPEVAEVFQVPVDTLLEMIPKQERRIIGGIARFFRTYEYGTQKIWGATAAILTGLLHRLKSDTL